MINLKNHKLWVILLIFKIIKKITILIVCNQNFNKLLTKADCNFYIILLKLEYVYL